ncbi:MAG: hypothetical protein AB8F95_10770 [Bacteroidia bacterium]
MRFPVYLTIALLAVSLLFGCKRYEDGPVISFKSRTERVQNEWKANVFSRNDLNELDQYEYMNVTVDADRFVIEAKFLNEDSVYRFDAAWELASLDRQIKTTFPSTVTNEDALLYFDIFKLKEDELWLEYVGNKALELPYTQTNNRYILRLEPR